LEEPRGASEPPTSEEPSLSVGGAPQSEELGNNDGALTAHVAARATALFRYTSIDFRHLCHDLGGV
jgi:hypothetical protein